jgi:hypothetical protein
MIREPVYFLGDVFKTKSMVICRMASIQQQHQQKSCSAGAANKLVGDYLVSLFM